MNQVSLQNDPFDLLKARANLVTDNYAILNETLEQGTEVAQLLKSVLKIDGHLRSQKVWVDEMDGRQIFHEISVIKLIGSLRKRLLVFTFTSDVSFTIKVL